MLSDRRARLYAADASAVVAYIVCDQPLPQALRCAPTVGLKVLNDLIGIMASRRDCIRHLLFAPNALPFGFLVAAAAVVGAHSGWRAAPRRMDAQANVGTMVAASAGAQLGTGAAAGARSVGEMSCTSHQGWMRLIVSCLRPSEWTILRDGTRTAVRIVYRTRYVLCVRRRADERSHSQSQSRYNESVLIFLTGSVFVFRQLESRVTLTDVRVPSRHTRAAARSRGDPLTGSGQRASAVSRCCRVRAAHAAPRRRRAHPHGKRPRRPAVAEGWP